MFYAEDQASDLPGTRMPVYEVTSSRGKVLYSGWDKARALRVLAKHPTATGLLHTFQRWTGTPNEPVQLS